MNWGLLHLLNKFDKVPVLWFYSLCRQPLVTMRLKLSPEAIHSLLSSFGVWGTLGSGGRVGAVMLVLRTFPGLVGRSVQNLEEIGPAVRA